MSVAGTRRKSGSESLALRSVRRRRLAVPELRAGALDDLGEADHGHRVVVVELPAVDLAQEGDRLVEAPELGVVVLDVPRRQLTNPLDLDVVDHGGEDLLLRVVLVADGDPNDLAAL